MHKVKFSRRMKGMSISDIITTAIVLIIIGFIVMMMLIINIINSLTSEPQGFVVSFVKSANEPFSVFEGISHLKFRERQMFEHLLSAAAAVSLQKADSTGAENALSDFVGSYKKSIYILALSSGDKNIFQITNIRGTSIESFSCGENAFCMDDIPSGFVTFGGVCHVGTVGIDDTGKKCKASQYCCQYDIDNYKNPNRNKNKPNSQKIFDVVSCGKNKAGICNAGAASVNPATGDLITIPYCGNGFVIVDDPGNDCDGANNGMTPVCCAFASATQLEKARITQKADAPLLYKGLTMFEQKEYRCQDMNTKCNGEYIGGLCGEQERTNSNIQCCVTDEIRCKSLNGDYSYNKYFCRDASHCPEDGNKIGIIKNICPDPEPSNYRCCTVEQPYKEDNSRKAAPTKDFGSCYLTGSPYSGKPVFGKLEVSTG